MSIGGILFLVFLFIAITLLLYNTVIASGIRRTLQEQLEVSRDLLVLSRKVNERTEHKVDQTKKIVEHVADCARVEFRGALGF